MSTNFLSPIEILQWTPAEKKIARRAFDAALAREVAAIRVKVRKMIGSDSTSVWRIHDYLTDQRNHVDQVYVYRYSRLILVFARLLRDGWLEPGDLEGLSRDKLQHIDYLAKR
jgi:hypothetical protein